MKHVLSKSTFMFGCQCPKRLFLHKYRSALRNPRDEQQQYILDSGTSIGVLAQQLFPGGVDASPPNPYSYHISVAKTKTFIDQGHDIIYEAAFQYEGVMCALDLLVRKGNTYYAFEVKSTTSVKPQHIQDAALQYFVVTHSGIPLADISIIHLNNQYIRNGAIDIHQLFTTESVLPGVLELQEFVSGKIPELKVLLAERKEPVIDIGPHCLDPYECDFTNHCWSHIPKENSIFELARGPVWKLYTEGYKHLDEIPHDYELNGLAGQQLAHHRSGEELIQVENLMSFLEPLTYPLYFLDFETFMPGIPEFDNSRPYQQIPFQFSLHIRQQPGGALQHYAFLGDGVNDPRQALAEELVQRIGESGSIICYHMGFERSRIKELADLFPHRSGYLNVIHDRIVDLMVPFQQRWYFHPEFKGSYSIKSVLPVLIPELRYDSLEIQEGGMASLVYSQLRFHDEEVRTEYREQLLAYCNMDTLAMVEIHDKLRAVVTENWLKE
jgi:hypothetical protein